MVSSASPRLLVTDSAALIPADAPLDQQPHNVAALAHCGITVDERVPHAFPSNGHDDFYMATKAAHFDHRFRLGTAPQIKPSR